MPKCPKCQYFSFDSGDRCRNCGYDFSLAVEPPPSDLEIQNGKEPVGPFGDFTLHEPARGLPLFTPGTEPDAPLVPPNPTPRAPLAVRRGPTPGRPARPKRERADRDPEPRLALDTAEFPIVAVPSAPEPELGLDLSSSPPAPAAASELDSRRAGMMARIGAAAVDFSLLAVINVMVLYFTLRICDLTFADITLLPGAPVISFLLLVDGGYLATFVAAGGQTIGKMATGIRVVPADPAAPRSEHVTFGHALVRAAALLLGLVPAGLGLLPVLFGDHRGLHDRLADTRVVKA
ncbi:MAG TPA: RDD family protein [Vicinamibacterales bacterium]|jgi:uncharacterized RDD family membrane protein YckC